MLYCYNNFVIDACRLYDTAIRIFAIDHGFLLLFDTTAPIITEPFFHPSTAEFVYNPRIWSVEWWLCRNTA